MLRRARAAFATSLCAVLQPLSSAHKAAHKRADACPSTLLHLSWLTANSADRKHSTLHGQRYVGQADTERESERRRHTTETRFSLMSGPLAFSPVLLQPSPLRSQTRKDAGTERLQSGMRGALTQPSSTRPTSAHATRPHRGPTPHAHLPAVCTSTPRSQRLTARAAAQAPAADDVWEASPRVRPRSCRVYDRHRELVPYEEVRGHTLSACFPFTKQQRVWGH